MAQWGDGRKFGHASLLHRSSAAYIIYLRGAALAL